MTNYRALTIAATLALSAFAAQAQSNNGPEYGQWSNYPATESSPSTLTREAVIADLVAARANGTLPRGGEWYDVPAPLAISNQSTSTLTRAEVRADAIAAAKTNGIVHGDH